MDAERLWITLRVALETHGWTLLLVASLLLVARSQFRAFLQRAHEKRTLAAANGASARRQPVSDPSQGTDAILSCGIVMHVNVRRAVACRSVAARDFAHPRGAADTAHKCRCHQAQVQVQAEAEAAILRRS